MGHYQFVLSAVALAVLILLSAFFSAAETGLMSINRYRLRHQARLKKKSAILILRLLKRPDRLLGMILIGNTCCNIFASAISTLLAVELFGEKAVILTSILLTLVVLVFSEVSPKTFAALYPERISKAVIWPIYALLILFYPVVWLLNGVSNGLLRLMGVKMNGSSTETLSRDELRSLIYETKGRLTNQYQTMLLGILDLNKMTVDDVMVPRHQIVGIDIEASWKKIQLKLSKAQYDWLPIYRKNINQITGILHLRDLVNESFNHDETVNKEKLLSIMHGAYFIPEGTPLNIQLVNFQNQKKRLALVVDEYGEISGLVTLADIFEEIVGEFTTTVTAGGKRIESQKDGSYLVDGAITLRELNRVTNWNFSTNGPRTLSGLVIEYLEAIPKTGISICIANHPIEIIEVKKNRIKLARLFPALNK